ncbi:meiosis-specific protein MEI4 isoform 1-T2 [Anableps anableps]
METQPGHLNGSSPAPWRLIKAQLAVAVAIIRTSPPGVSGREHGEALGRRMRRQDGAWRERARGLQQEVLRLRQELLVATTTANTNSSLETADHTILEDLSQDLFGPGSSAFSADPPPDCDSETPDLLLPEPPPPSRQQGDPWSDALLPHMRFLQSLWSLQRLDSSSRAFEAQCLTPEGAGGSVVAETVCVLLDSVVGVCRDPPAPGLPDLVLQACQAASRALDLLCSRRPSVDLMRRVEEPLRELTQMLLRSRHPCRAAEQLKESLLALGSSSISKSFLICHILSEISSLAEQLWQTSQVQESSVLQTFPMDQYQNSCHLLWVLEKLLQDPEAAWWRAEVELEKTAFLRRLELRVFLLWDEFPLFSIFMWRIGNLLTSTREKHV